MDQATAMDRKLLALEPDLASPQPVAIQFFQKLKIAITAGYWLPNEVLPGIAQFAALFKLPEAVVQIAFDQLVSESWLRCDEQGHYLITPKIDQPVSRLSNLSDLLHARGFKAGSVWLKREIAAPNIDEQWRLKLQTGAKVSRLQRLRTANDVVIGYESTSLPSSILPDPNAVGTSLYQFMNEHNLVIAKAVEEIDAFSCDAAMAALCGFELNKALLRLTRVSFLPNGRAFELTYSYFRSDYYRYVVEFND
ncbi:GntR family transcriptional regulator [Chitinibacter bivalviorum]|uniref:GntR family transcriptional regulator n=1 Tax=Chitinibacter bivalviorum TaxID=2739434 RepID=A0A7H9BKU3_9NEIS|nr:GntR family transcriptional regulator [Chitinibacter bivalviorum]QLG88946.1 GntR family transcriptional regulator [Chitinibacter bivalviorum]